MSETIDLKQMQDDINQIKNESGWFAYCKAIIDEAERKGLKKPELQIRDDHGEIVLLNEGKPFATVEGGLGQMHYFVHCMLKKVTKE